MTVTTGRTVKTHRPPARLDKEPALIAAVARTPTPTTVGLVVSLSVRRKPKLY